LPKDWAEELLKMAEKDFNNSAPSLAVCVKEKQDTISTLNIRLERLLNGYLEQDIEREIYRDEKSKLLLRKKSLDEEMSSLSRKQNTWLEPFQNWVNVAQGLDKIASDSDLFAKKVCAKEIFGSNLLLGEKTVRASALDSGNSHAIPPKNPWSALCAVRLHSHPKPTSSLLVRLFYQIRTCFQNQSK
jgi:hypothetical protein